MERLFAALADRTRLRLLNLLAGDEVCVCYFVEVLQMNQPNISRHLAYLKSAGIVAARRDGKWMHYRITEPADSAAARILREVRQWLSIRKCNATICDYRKSVALRHCRKVYRAHRVPGWYPLKIHSPRK